MNVKKPTCIKAAQAQTTSNDSMRSVKVNNGVQYIWSWASDKHNNMRSISQTQSGFLHGFLTMAQMMTKNTANNQMEILLTLSHDTVSLAVLHFIMLYILFSLQAFKLLLLLIRTLWFTVLLWAAGLLTAGLGGWCGRIKTWWRNLPPITMTGNKHKRPGVCAQA